jgi:hypothetical protein
VDLFIQTGNPVHVFNQGRCYEQNHRWEEALDRFREYLRKEHTLDAHTRSYVDKHIAECESHLAKAAVVTPLPPAPPAVIAPSVETPAPVPPPAAASAVAPAVASDSGSTLRIVGIVTGAVGVAAVGYGTYQYIRHESLIDDVRKNGDQFSDDQFSDKQSQINDSKIKSWVGFGIGVTALLAGTTMYLLARAPASSGTERALVTVVPSISSGQTSLFLSGAF